MMSQLSAQAASIFRWALRESGAACYAVWRVPKDENGVATGPAEQIGCVYGMRYVRGQTANILIDIPGVVARTDAKRMICDMSGCASAIRCGDIIKWPDAWMEVIDVQGQLDILTDIVLQEGADPNGVLV